MRRLTLQPIEGTKHRYCCPYCQTPVAIANRNKSLVSKEGVPLSQLLAEYREVLELKHHFPWHKILLVLAYDIPSQYHKGHDGSRSLYSPEVISYLQDKGHL